jgi:hypothetical protein
MELLKLWAVLYSFEQKCFHIEYVHEYLKSNMQATIYKKDHQYRLIAFAKDGMEAHKICDKLEKDYPSIFL